LADETPNPLQSWVFDFVTSSYQPFAPLRSMPHSGFRATSFNGLMHEGQFRKRPGLSSSSPLVIAQNGQYTEKYNGQTPGDIQVYYMDPISATVEGPFFIVLTTTECYIVSLSPTTVTNVTPRYTVGTVSITTATTALTGIGTAWDTEGIKAGQLVIFPDASVSVIDSVNSDTSITLKAAYAGSTLVSQPYTIRRTGRYAGVAQSGAPLNLFARVFNGDLYYTFVEGTTNFCVVRVTNINGIRSASIGTPEIIGAFQYDNLSGCDLWSATISDVLEIKGLELLTDGRVVLATTEKDTGGTTASARIRYSSHLDQKVWNSPPGGFSDVVNLPGDMNGMKSFGSYLACHFDGGIVLAVPTGQDDPPLNFQTVQTTRIGCFNSKAIVNTPQGQVFLGTDGNTYVFDGSGHTMISDATRKTFPAATAHSGWHGCYEYKENTVWLFDMYGSTDGTGMYAIDMSNGQTTYHKTATIISAAADPGNATQVTRLLVGLPTYDPLASGAAGASSTILYLFSYSNTADTVPAFTGFTATAAMSLITDWIDFDMMGIDKTFAYALLFYESSGSYTVRLKAARDGLSTDTISFNTVTTAGEEKFAKIFFAPKTSEKWQFTLDTATTNASAWDIRPQRMVLFFRPVAGSEAVQR
jgi:hypothetical protein